MTDEELKKEAEEWVISNTEIYDDKFGIECEKEPQAKEAYIAGAETREKRIAELEESNNEWQRTCEAKSDTNSQLTEQLADKVEEIAKLTKAKEIIKN